MRKRLSFAFALALAVAPAASQQKEPTTYDRAIAAGYKALTLCSGIFNAGRTQAQVEALELRGIYPEYDAIVPTLAATVDRRAAVVTVPFSAALAPRKAEARAPNGCTLLPISSNPAQRSGTGAPPRPGADPRRWPLGDAGISRTPIPRAAELALLGALRGESAPYGLPAGARPATTALVVVKNGRIVAEIYLGEFDAFTSQRTWSVAKSIATTLIGIAEHQAVMTTASATGIPEWRADGDGRRLITTDNLLRMASGLHSNTAGNRTDAIYFGGTAVTEQATGWPLEARPGSRFRYANNDTLLAIRALRASLGDARYAGFPRGFFEKLGMRHTVAETDWQGNFILSSQVWSTARDLARFGQLYLNDGVWNGERILPKGWVKYVTTPFGPQPDGDFGYGAGFWLMNKSPGIPAGTFAAIGNRGQYVVIVPSRDMVIVRRGEDPAGTRFDIARFTADMLKGME